MAESWSRSEEIQEPKDTVEFGLDSRGGFAFPNGNGDTQLELDETQACAPFETLASLDAETQDLDPEDEAEYKSKSRYGV